MLHHARLSRRPGLSGLTIAPPLRQHARPGAWCRSIGALLLACSLAGCGVIPALRGPAPTEADFATIAPGMTRQDLLSRFGAPTWTFGVRQENLTIWNYRFDRVRCIIYQVSVRPDGTVRDAGPAWDPACDGPSHAPP